MKKTPIKFRRKNEKFRTKKLNQKLNKINLIIIIIISFIYLKAVQIILPHPTLTFFSKDFIIFKFIIIIYFSNNNSNNIHNKIIIIKIFLRQSNQKIGNFKNKIWTKKPLVILNKIL